MEQYQLERARMAIQRAIRAVGSQAKLARLCGVSQPAVSKWDVCPVMRALEMERLTGIPREELRPDVYTPRNT